MDLLTTQVARLCLPKISKNISKQQQKDHADIFGDCTKDFDETHFRIEDDSVAPQIEKKSLQGTKQSVFTEILVIWPDVFNKN